MAGLERYSRQGGIVDQGRLSRSRALVVGVGGLGNFVAAELTLAGVGTIHLVDPDVVDVHNLNRQFLYRDEDVGQPKATVAARRLSEINPYVMIKGFVSRWQGLDVNGYDIVFDCLDVWSEKLALMQARDGLLISGSVGEDVGYTAVLDKKRIEKANIRETRSTRVLGARVGVVASIMANEGIRELGGEPSPLRDRMLYIDFGRMAFHLFEL